MMGADTLPTELARLGLLSRGGFEPASADALPALPGGRPAAWVALVGVAGSALWPHFESSVEYRDGMPDPLDRWTRRIGSGLAARLGGLALFPFDGPPYWPFPRWAERAEGLRVSPIGLRVHPDYGLWHSYRLALALPYRPQRSATAAASTDLCAQCPGQPCLRACPVDAFQAGGFALDRCVQALQSDPPPPCRSHGCSARHACPIGAGWQPRAEHARFLMDAFVADHAP